MKFEVPVNYKLRKVVGVYFVRQGGMFSPTPSSFGIMQQFLFLPTAEYTAAAAIYSLAVIGNLERQFETQVWRRGRRGMTGLTVGQQSKEKECALW
jgi:hypothetical protein